MKKLSRTPIGILKNTVSAVLLAGLSITLISGCSGGSSSPSNTDTSTDPVITDPVIIDPVITDPVVALPVTVNDATFTSTHFSGSANCAACHNALSDASAVDVSIESDWASSMLANSTRDPFWKAKVASELQRNPELKEVIDNKCSRCHAPMANVEIKYEGLVPELFGEGMLNPQNAHYDQAMDGVSCAACHQIEDNGLLGTLEGISGKFSIVDLGVAERTAYGQYVNPSSVNAMLNNTGFRPVAASHISSSELCASCHDLKTPFVDSAGNIVSTTPESEFPEQMIYSEWENSSFASGVTTQSCQDCHMPKTDGVVISTRPMGMTARDNFSRHTLVGANTTMLDILANNKQALGVTATGFDTTITRTREMLNSAADIEVLSKSIINNELTVQLRVTNRSGHKLPSGYPSRRVYIHFVVRDAAGNIVFESGKTNTDGSIVAANSDETHNSYETHYNEISSEDQVQIYEAMMVNTDNEITYTLLRSASYIKDNRLPPAGFDKTSVPDDIRVAGAALNDNDFNAASDVITYKINIGTNTTVSFDAGLKYQSLAYGFMQDLFLDADNPEVAKFKTMFDNAAIRSETIDAINGSVSQ